MSVKHQMLREKVKVYLKKLYDRKLVVGSWGNISMRIPGEDLVLICPNGEVTDHFKKEDIGIFDMEGHLIDGEIMPTGYWHLHLSIYKENPEVGAIIVSNAPYIQAFAISNEKIPLCAYDQEKIIGGAIPCIHIEALEKKEGISIMMQSKATLLYKYGIICYGASLEEAYDVMALSERTAKSSIFSRILQ